jgi:aminopeptidase N
MVPFIFREVHRMKIAAALALGVLVAQVVSAQAPPGHRLPGGNPRPVREREVDVEHLDADLAVDLARGEVSGTATMRVRPLRSRLAAFSVDAAGLEVRKVELMPGRRALQFKAEKAHVRIELPAPADPSETRTVAITYSARPKSGLYVFQAQEGRPAQAWNYGEGGLHFGWIPLYNDMNDRFTVDMAVTVPRPFVALGNGVLRDTRDAGGGRRTYLWVQEKPIPNYLLALNVGEFAETKLEDARVGQRRVPLSVWAPPGTKTPGYAFRDTPRMVEFFSRRFAFPYAWAKYDQVLLRDFAGAMETTTMVGFAESYRHSPDDPLDGGPAVTRAYPTWTYEDTVSHELAHHWFGDLVTGESLGSLWLNESFATFCQTLWTGEAHGEDDMTFQRWHYLDRYLGYVRDSGIVRPMEFLRYETPSDLYQEETTYLKGAVVLHMLRQVVGGDDFDRAIAAYLDRHQFGNVESEDLRDAIEKTTGKNLSNFFEDWIVGGGGHPVFEVSYRWSPERRQVDLSISQTQADLGFENDFRLPVDVEVITGSGARTHRVQIDGWSTSVALPADAKPLAVVFDKGGWLVADTHVARGLDEVLYLLERGGLAERLRAARQLATDYGRRPRAVAALAAVLGDAKAHWGLRLEAARGLGAVGGAEATGALIGSLRDADRRVRRAAVVALAGAGGAEAGVALGGVIESDPAEDVVASANWALGRMHAPNAKEVLIKQLGRESKWSDVIRVGALRGLAELEDPSLAQTFAGYTGPGYVLPVRWEALDAWQRVSGDAAFATRMRELARDPARSIRETAVRHLGSLHRAEDVAFLRELAAAEVDPTLAHGMRSAAEGIEAFTSPKR